MIRHDNLINKAWDRINPRFNPPDRIIVDIWGFDNYASTEWFAKILQRLVSQSTIRLFYLSVVT